MESRALVLAFGEFGSLVAGHLQARGGRPRGGLVWQVAGGPFGSRQAAADGLRSRLSLGWPELEEALATLGDGALQLVAAADEAAGGGQLTAALDHLGRRYPCQVWMALPVAGAGPAELARAYATLLELEEARGAGRMQACWLHEQRGERAEQAQLMGDGLLLAPHQAPAGWLAFGVGVVRNPEPLLRRRLALQVAGRELDHYLHQPDPAHLLPPLREGLNQPVQPLLIPLEAVPAYEQGWGAAGGSGALDGLLDYYDPSRPWYQAAWSYWEAALANAYRGLTAAVAHPWRSGFAAVEAEMRAGLHQLHITLETAIERIEDAVAAYRECLDAARQAAGAGHVNLDEMDRLVAGYLIQSMRLGVLDRLALAVDGVLELTLDQIRAKVVAAAHLEQLLRARPSAVHQRVAHALVLQPSAEQERSWAGAIQPRWTRVALEGEGLSVTALLEAAGRDVDRFFHVQQPALHLPVGHKLRQAWLQSTVPSLRLTGHAAPFGYAVTPGLPVDYQQELAAQAGRPVALHTDLWFADEWAVWAESGAVRLPSLAVLPALRDAYRAAPPPVVQSLHGLPVPDGGWPTL